ncbi:MAG: hypothetical protein DCC75_12440, partial [Proteobacteria bacterium]
ERDVLYSVYKVNNEIIEVTVHMREPGYYQIDPASQGATFARVKQLSQGAAQFEIGGAEHQLNYRTIPQGIWLKLGTVQFAAELSHKPIKRAELSAKGTHHIVTSPLPGKILSVKAKEGRHVEAGETLLILESMKMEHLIRASAGGLVRRISVQEGNTVQAGALLLEFDHTH